MIMLHRKARIVLAALSLTTAFGIARADTSGPDEPFKNARETSAAVESGDTQPSRSVAALQSFVGSFKQKANSSIAEAERSTAAEQGVSHLAKPSVLERFDTQLSN
jgi:hypothetical protein